MTIQMTDFDTLYLCHSRGERIGEVILDAVAAAIKQSRTVRADDIATILDVPKRDVSAAVRMLTGLSLGELLHRWRQRQAKELLAEGKLSEAEVAFRCGWLNVRTMRRNLTRMDDVRAKDTSSL